MNKAFMMKIAFDLMLENEALKGKVLHNKYNWSLNNPIY